MTIMALLPLFFHLLEMDKQSSESKAKLQLARSKLEEPTRGHVDKNGIKWRNGWWECKHCSHKTSHYMNYRDRFHCYKCGQPRFVGIRKGE